MPSTAITRPTRSGPAARVRIVMPSGISMPPPRPCRTRKRTSISSDVAAAQSTEPAVKSATASSLEMLVGFRVLQGLGGGMLMPLGMTILTRAAGPERVGRVMAVLGIPMLLGPIFGPIVGGALIDSASWHWIFLINLPIGIAAFVYAFIVLPKDDVEPSETFDWVGMMLLSPGLALFLYGVSSIPEAKQEDGTIWTLQVVGPAVVGALLIIGFVPWALNRNNLHPLVDLRLFTNRTMTVAVLAMSLFAISFFGASLLFPLYFQSVRGEDALSAGLLLAPQGIGAMITMPIAGILADKIGPGKIVLAGIAVITVGMGMFTQIQADTSYAYLMVALFIMGLGMGGTMMPIMSAALATLKEHAIARGSTLMNIAQQVAASIGTALFSVLLTNGTIDLDPTNPTTYVPGLADAFATVFVVATILVASVLIPAAFLPRKKVAQPVDPALLVGH